jgi:NosR/NirI family transcriptional regulator, nitrous oxide reductase regulator
VQYALDARNFFALNHSAALGKTLMSGNHIQSYRQTPVRRSSQALERTLGGVAILTIFIAWFVGLARDNVVTTPEFERVFPTANRFEKINDLTYAAYASDYIGTPLGYVALGESYGYGGLMKVAVAVDLQGNVTGLEIVEDSESPEWLTMVYLSGFIESLIGKSYQDPFKLGEDIDGVTGATYSSGAIAGSVLQASRTLAKLDLGFALPEETAPRIIFGIPEITLALLFVVGYFGHQRKFRYKKVVRWASMLVGLIVLGFIYNRPLTIAHFNRILLGYFPPWQTNIYWYLLVGGILLVFSVDNKNPYCEWFCPFGAAQECVGAIGGAKIRSPGNSKNFLLWIQRGLAWLAILLAVLFRNPGLSSYEVFGALFDRTGSSWQFALLGIVLVAALFIHRPWCTYLCPLRPVLDIYRTIRKWIIETWKILAN